MLLLYYTNTILFWLSLPNSNPNPSLTKQLDKHDLQYLPQEVCIAQCMKRKGPMKASTEPALIHMHFIEELYQKSPLELCVEYCTKFNAVSDQNTTSVKQIHENYSLNLICRDESSLNFLINLHTMNERWNSSQQTGETDMTMTTSTSPTLTSTSLSFVSSLTSPSQSASTSTSAPASASRSDDDGDDDVVLFVIKIHLANETDIYKVYLSDDKFFTLDQLSPNTTYNVTAFAVHSHNKYSVIALGEQFQTLRGGYTPGNITNIKVVNFVEDILNPTHLSATVIWRPPPDLTCYYDVICFSPISNDFEMQPVEIRNPRQLYKYQLDNMTFSTEYMVGIRAKNIKNMKESALFWKTFNAPSCAQWHNYNFNICAPYAPEKLQYQLYFAAQNLYSVNVSWNRPTYYPDNYTLSINDLSPFGHVHYFNISKDMNNFFIEEIAIYSAYIEVLLTASTLGGNATSLAEKIAGSVNHVSEKNHFVKLFAVILALVFCVAILSMTIFMIYHRRAKLKRYQERCKYFEELEKKAPIDPKDNFDFVNPLNASKRRPSNDLHISMETEDNSALFNDEMEIDRNQLTLYEVLGEGAFGLVKRGIYKDNKLSVGGDGGVGAGAGGNVHEVAVKMLKDHPTADDVRAFRREIEVMKSVEKHPNIVGILGHCTRFSNEMMLLTEYCSFGNLLDFLRDEWRFLHEIQQRKQKHSSVIVDVELPHVLTNCANDMHEWNSNTGMTTKTSPATSPPTSPPPPVPHIASVLTGVNGECTNRLEEMENIKNNQHNTESFNTNNSSKLIIERFKKKYNEFSRHQHDNGNGNGNAKENCNPTVWDNRGQDIENITDATTTTYNTAKVNGSWPDNRHDQNSANSSPLISPAAENKSYGYHGCCTNSCKCKVDVIIRNIDSSDSSKEQEELDRLLLNQQQQQHRHPHSHQSCCTTIAINSCDCRTHKNAPSSATPPPPLPVAKNKSRTGIENKSYFKIFSGDRLSMSRRQRAIAGFKSTTNTTTVSTISNSCTSITNEALTTAANNDAGNDDDNADNDDNDDKWPNRVPLKSGDLLDIARQVAVGMDFLSKNKVVHRDLAARNVLVAPDRTIKIADFGLSRDVYQENIYKKTGNGKLPIKWLALESLTHQVYTTQSDVWSYGILLYEIVTLGATPYPSIPTNRLLHLLKSGYRMEKPKNSDNEFYALMSSCWNGVPNERPTFGEIIKNLNEMLNRPATSTPTANATERRLPPPPPTPAQQSPSLFGPLRDECEVWNRKNKNYADDDDDDDDDDGDMGKQESPIQQLCNDDSYLNPL